MSHPETASEQRQPAPAREFSTEPQSDSSASTAQPSLASGADFQPDDQLRTAVQPEGTRGDALMRRYNS